MIKIRILSEKPDLNENVYNGAPHHNVSFESGHILFILHRRSESAMLDNFRKVN